MQQDAIWKTAKRSEKYCLSVLKFLMVSGYHADTPITIKAEDIRKADSRLN